MKLAAFNATDAEKRAADVVCLGEVDVAVINAAFRASPVVQLSSGTFRVGAARTADARTGTPIVITDGNLYGIPGKTRIELANGAAEYHSDRYGMLFVEGNNIVIEGIRFAGNRQNLSQDQNILNTRNCDNLTIRDCVFDSPYHMALAFGQGTKRVRVEQTRFTGDVTAATGAYVYSECPDLDATFLDCDFEGILDHQAFYVGAGSVKVRRSRFVNCWQVLDVRAKAHDCELSDSTCIGGTHFVAVTQPGATNTRVVNVKVRDHHGLGTSRSPGIVFQDHGIGTLIAGCDVEQTGTQGAQLLIIGGQGGQFIGNRLRSNRMGANTCAVELMKLYDARAAANVIEGNTIENAANVWGTYGLDAVNFARRNRIVPGWVRYIIDRSKPAPWPDLFSSQWLVEEGTVRS